MPKITFDGFVKHEENILTKTFRANCEALGLCDADLSVHVNKQDLGRPSRYGNVGHLKPGTFEVNLNSNGFNLFDATSCLGHEAVHMKQYHDGRMKDGDHGIEWCGENYPHLLTEIFYRDMPWEAEAWGKQAALHKHALSKLAKSELKHVDRSQSQGLHTLWSE